MRDGALEEELLDRAAAGEDARGARDAARTQGGQEDEVPLPLSLTNLLSLLPTSIPAIGQTQRDISQQSSLGCSLSASSLRGTEQAEQSRECIWGVEGKLSASIFLCLPI